MLTAVYPIQVGDENPVALLREYTVKPLAALAKTFDPRVGALPRKRALVRPEQS
jgi:hypothetical protein